MRSILAALDWNFNIGRKYKLSKSGEQLYKSKVCIFFINSYLKEAKDRGFQDLIFNSCLEALENDTVPQVNVGLLFNKNMIADNLCTYLVSH